MTKEQAETCILRILDESGACLEDTLPLRKELASCSVLTIALAIRALVKNGKIEQLVYEFPRYPGTRRGILFPRSTSIIRTTDGLLTELRKRGK